MTSFAKRAAENAHQWYAILVEFGTTAQAPEDTAQLLEYAESLSETLLGEFTLLGDFLKCLRSAF